MRQNESSALVFAIEAGNALKKGWDGICLPIGKAGPVAENTGSLCCAYPEWHDESETNPLFLRMTHDNVC